MLDYRIEHLDPSGLRLAVFDEVPLLEVTRNAPGQPDTIRGMLPVPVASLSHGDRLRVYVAGAWFCDAFVTRVEPRWSDTRKLILDRYVPFHEVVSFEAQSRPGYLDAHVARAYEDAPISTIVKSLINSALGPIHYTVSHTDYPDGAEREFAKFIDRKTPENELEIGGISHGHWVGSNRIDASSAYAKDGDTIAGLVVDGSAWPDVRLMMIDCEETSRNAHAISRHPEAASWTNEQYNASGYKLRADAAKAALQQLLDDYGIDYVELNPHRNSNGEFDDRVDAYGRYIALLYGGGRCFNAAQVERGHADVYLWQDGEYHVPEMELKDFFSYVGPHADSIGDVSATLTLFDANGALFATLTALAYAAGHCVWTLEPDNAIFFHEIELPGHVIFFDPLQMGVGLGSDRESIANILYFHGDPLSEAASETYRRDPSIAEYGERTKSLNYYSIAASEDASALAESVLDDLAYPEPVGYVQFFHGNADIRLGAVLEFRGAPIRRLERRAAGEWGDVFTDKLVARVRQITHRLSGKQVSTTIHLTSPLRSITTPISSITHSQNAAFAFYQFRLDEPAARLDATYHLD